MTDPRNEDRIKTWIDPSRAESPKPAAFSPAREYIDSLGAGSRRTMRQCLGTVAAVMVGAEVDPHTFRWELLTQKDVNMIVAYLTESTRADNPDKLQYHPATIKKMLAALRGTMRAAERHARDNKLSRPASIEWTTIEPRPQVNGDQGPAPRLITAEIIQRLFDGCTDLATIGDEGSVGSGASGGRRDAAMLAVFLGTGLRRNEALMLDLADYNPATATLQIRGESPEKVRTVTFQRGARGAMRDWLQVRGDKPGPLFLPVGRGGIVRHRRMTTQAVYDIIDRIARRANLHPLTTRDIRRAYVVSLIRSGKTHEQVKALTGHASWINAQVCEQLKHERAGEGYDVNNLPYKTPAPTPTPETPPTKAQPPETDNTNPPGSRP